MYVTNTTNSITSNVCANRIVMIGRASSASSHSFIVIIAIDRTVKGEKKTDFPRITVFGKDAENLEKFSGKGLKIAVEGRLETDSYKKGDDMIYTTNIIAERVYFLDFKPKDDTVPIDFSRIDGDIPF